MSNSFFGSCIQGIPSLILSSNMSSQLLYLRGFKGRACTPLINQQHMVPAAWYKPARKLMVSLRDSVELRFNLSESALSQHLQAAALCKADRAGPQFLQDDVVKFTGSYWSILLGCSSPSFSLFMGVKACNQGRVRSCGSAAAKADAMLRLLCALTADLQSSLAHLWLGLGAGNGYRSARLLSV